MYQVFRVPTHHLGLSNQPDYTVSDGTILSYGEPSPGMVGSG